jgi:hypothetical protein
MLVHFRSPSRRARRAALAAAAARAAVHDPFRVVRDRQLLSIALYASDVIAHSRLMRKDAAGQMIRLKMMSRAKRARERSADPPTRYCSEAAVLSTSLKSAVA